jgi:catechol 2,3-dioxygenase-like lactoylglutathione lyase family enzyme
MKFAYTIVYVADVRATIKFYNQAFGIETGFLHDSGDYAELNTGTTKLAFASFELGHSNFPCGYSKLTELDKPAGIEIAFATEDVNGAVQNALNEGAKLIAQPLIKPWGQTVAYVQAPDGTLIELCTPMA